MLLLRVDVLIHLALVWGLVKAGVAARLWVPAVFILADAARLWLAARWPAAYVAWREWLVCLVQPLYFTEAHFLVPHGVYLCLCSWGRAAFWAMHLISSALNHLVLGPLGMPVRFRSAGPMQALSLALVLLSDRVRCGEAMRRCPNAPGWYEEAAALLRQLSISIPFPTAVPELRGQAACVAVHDAFQVVLGSSVRCALYEMERRRRAAFAKAVGRREERLELLRRRRGRAATLGDIWLVFVCFWQLQSLALPLLYPH